MSAENADVTIKASIALLNFLIMLTNDSQTNRYIPHNFADSANADGSTSEGSWRVITKNDTCFSLKRVKLGSSNYNGLAKNVRETFASYFINEGAVPWQVPLL